MENISQYLGYFVGPIVVFAGSIGYTVYIENKYKKVIDEANKRVEKVEKLIEVIDKQTLQKMVVTLQPVAGELESIKSFVGMQ